MINKEKMKKVLEAMDDLAHSIKNAKFDGALEANTVKDRYNLLASEINELNKNIEQTSDKAIEYVQESYCDAHLNMPYMLLGDVAELIEITTGKEVDWDVLTKYSR